MGDYGQSFTAKYGNGQCGDCAKPIKVGQKVRFRYPGKTLCHVDCPRATPKYDYPTITVSGGSGYGCHGWTVGHVIINPYHGNDHYGVAPEARIPEYLYVIETSTRYFREDGMSFGVGDESGYTYSAICRAASDDESSPLRAKIEEKHRKQNAVADLKAIAKEIQEGGEYPDGDHLPEGDIWFDTQNIRGGGEWFVVGTEWIWYVRNNGADGDDWSRNNVRTGGAGAIGYRVNRNDDLVSRLAEIKNILL